jgi:hypothetical protein
MKKHRMNIFSRTAIALLLPAAAHVVQTAESITVKFLDGEMIPARD